MKKKYHATQRLCMKKLRSEGKDEWRNKKRDAYNRKTYKKSTISACNANQKWTIDDINKITNKTKSDLKLSKELGRSVMAIQVKRCMLKKI